MAAMAQLPGELQLAVMERATPTVPALAQLARHSPGASVMLLRVLGAGVQWAWLYRRTWGATAANRSATRFPKLGWYERFWKALRTEAHTVSTVNALEEEMRERVSFDVDGGRDEAAGSTSGAPPPRGSTSALDVELRLATRARSRRQLVTRMYAHCHGVAPLLKMRSTPRGRGVSKARLSLKMRAPRMDEHVRRCAVWTEDWELFCEDRGAALAKLRECGIDGRTMRPLERGIAQVLLRLPQPAPLGPVGADVVDALASMLAARLKCR